MAIVKLVIAFFVFLPQLVSPYLQFAAKGGYQNFYDKWSAEDKFEKSYCFEMEKDPDKDFIVLNFSDIQLSDDTAFGTDGEYSEEMITKLVDEIKPDLITLSGDNCSSDVGYLRLVRFLDGLGVKWAPVMGNHDGDNGKDLKEAWDSFILANAENCVYKFGPEGMGNGNYIINITENGRIVHSLFMMDSHSSSDDTDAGKINYGKNEDGSDKPGYDHLWQNQLDWYEWAVNGLTAINNGKPVESTAIMHIPVIEFRSAMNEMCVEQKGLNIPKGGKNGEFSGEYTSEWVLKDEYKGMDGNFGSILEGICSPEGNNGFFELAKSLGSTKTMIFGHDHVNDLCLWYQGIHLCYSLKGGHGSYWTPGKIGGSVLSINSDGNASYAHHYYTAG